MSVQEMILEKPLEKTLISNRALGAVAMLFSPMLFAASFFFAAEPDQPSPYPLIASLGGFLYIAGAMASATGMRNLRVTGNGTGAAILYFVQMTGLFLAMCFDILSYAAPQLRDSPLFFVTDLAYPFSHLLMIIVGIAIIKAKVWRGWRRASAFLVGFALPSFFAAAAFFGHARSFYVFPAMVTAGFFMLGLAVYTTQNDGEK